MNPVTLRDIADDTGLTKSAVSLALRHDPRIPEATRKRIQESAERLGYRQNAVVAHLMAELRRGKKGMEKASIALLNLHHDPHAFQTHPTIPSYVKGCRERAGALGYSLDEIREPLSRIDGKRILSILQARGLRGCVLTGLMGSDRLPSGLEELWTRLPCVVTGVRTAEPQLPFSCADHHAVAQLAFAKAIGAGNTRPALVLDRGIDALVQGRFSAGFLIGQRELPERDRIPPFYHEEGKTSPPKAFVTWWRKHRPDVILTLYHVVADWLGEMGVKVPGETALIQLEVRPNRSGWAGVNQHNDRTGAAAVDLLVQMIHAGETGQSAVPRAMLTEPSWQDGATLPSRK
jgi:LacI family transcriptional regulator